MMKDAMLQLQMVIPSLKTDASFTATLNMDEDVLMDLETAINLPETSYQQKASLKYGNCQPSLTSSTRTDLDRFRTLIYLFICGCILIFFLQMMTGLNWN